MNNSQSNDKINSKTSTTVLMLVLIAIHLEHGKKVSMNLVEGADRRKPAD